MTDLLVADPEQELSLFDRLGAFGWGWSFAGDLTVFADAEGTVTIRGFNICALLPEQFVGLAGYTEGSFDLSISDLLPQNSEIELTFESQADGSYLATGAGTAGAVFALVGDRHQLTYSNGTTVVFNANGQLDYAETANGYRISATYTNGLLTDLSTSAGEVFTYTYNSSGSIESITEAVTDSTSVETVLTEDSATFSYDTSGQFLQGISTSDAGDTQIF